MLLRHRGADHGVAAVQHGPGDRPAGPAAVGAPHDVEAVGVEVPSAVLLVQQRHRELGQVHLVAGADVLLAGRPGGGDGDRRDGFRVHGADQVLQDVARGGLAGQPEVGGESPVFAPARGAEPGGRAEDPEAGGGTGERAEQRGGCVGLVGAPGDRAHLQVRVHLLMDRHRIVVGEELSEKVTKVQGRSVLGHAWASVLWVRAACIPVQRRATGALTPSWSRPLWSRLLWSRPSWSKMRETMWSTMSSTVSGRL